MLKPRLLIALLALGCGGSPTPPPPNPEPIPVAPTPEPVDAFEAQLDEVEEAASEGGRAVLAEGRRMIEEGEILRGGCWGYIDTIYTRAGYDRRARRVVFKGKKRGPYAPVKLIEPGDWLYYINHSYRGSPHSGIFVRWVDSAAKEALILSYGGGGRRAPGRYREYLLSSVYRITRPR